ncbi:hypothetical protein [Sediminibacterium salmoneum]|uniref:hypothetical protein n=1 Tax=Sediminibacterium salmoneum TaxID=426421 RepID=UPI0004791374|nr:hypothetical protein [Sediminibacterium salmoneum]
MAFNETVLAGVIGGLITSIAIPLTSYFGLRLLNCCFVDIKVEERNETIGYTVFNIRVRNRSLATLKKVTARVSIDNYNNDIIKESRIEIFCIDAKVAGGMLSWSKSIEGKNSPLIDINQGEEQDLNFIRYHKKDPQNAIEIASEQGFFDENNKTKSRTLLSSTKNYNFNLLITGDNFWPKKLKLTFIHDTKQLDNQ